MNFTGCRRGYKIFRSRNVQRPGNSVLSYNKKKSKSANYVTAQGTHNAQNAQNAQNVYDFDSNNQTETRIVKRKKNLSEKKTKIIGNKALKKQKRTDDTETETGNKSSKNTKTKPKGKKKFRGIITCKCKRGCADKIDILKQKEYFDFFHSLESFEEQTRMLRFFTTRVKVEKENLNPVTPRKLKKYQYICTLADDEGEMFRVCLPFFTKFMQIKRKKIYEAISSKDSNPYGMDHRGKHPKKMVHEHDMEAVTEFINQFHTYESQYHSHELSTKFLHPSLNMNGLYSQYKDLCTFRQMKPISKSTFVRIFKRDYNLAFLKGRKLKRCGACHEFNGKLRGRFKSLSGSELRNKKIEHLNLVRKVNREFTEDIENGKKFESPIEILTFEVFHPFGLPTIKDNATILMKQQFWQHVMLIYDELKQRCYVYTWSESIAAKGTAEITSCLRKHIQEHVNESTEKIILYTDPRSGQNRNFKMCLMLKHLLDSWPHDKLSSIEQRFFVPCHAENDCNVSFRSIERQKNKTENLFIPSDCVELMEHSKTKSPKFIIEEMQTSDFLSLAPLVAMFGAIENRNEIKKIDLSKQQKIINDRDDPLMMKFMKYSASVNEAPVTFPLLVPNGDIKFSDIDLPTLFPEGREISKKKFDDLQQLLQFIPTEYHPFFTNLKFNPENRPMPDFAFSLRESSDDED